MYNAFGDIDIIHSLLANSNLQGQNKVCVKFNSYNKTLSKCSTTAIAVSTGNLKFDNTTTKL